MKQLSYETLRENGYNGYLLKDAPERVIQFGEGNFLRAFVDYFIDMMNEHADFGAKVVLVQPIATPESAFDLAKAINEQNGLYTLYLRGFENGQEVNDKRIISCVSRCLNVYSNYEAVMACAKNPDLRYIVCNTTEAGIVYDPSCKWEETPPSSYPAKLTQFLYRRFQHFGKEHGKGFVILSCELIDNNGKELEKCVLQYIEQWGLEKEFRTWVQEENVFCSTLVDRIVTGYPRGEADELNEQNHYIDQVMDTGEVFGFWVIEGPKWLKQELPFDKANLPVLITDDHKPYKQRKVRILNGAHTSMVLGAYLAGQDIVRDCMHDDVIRSFMNKTIYDEIIPTLTLPREELMDFSHSVTERFQNPFIDHTLLSISLNSTAKWKARVMPSLLGYVEKNGTLPSCIVASFAFYLTFYHGDQLTDAGLIAHRKDETYTVKDDKAVLEFFYEHRCNSPAELAHAVMSNTAFWGRDLTQIVGFEQAVVTYLEDTMKYGAYEVMKKLI